MVKRILQKSLNLFGYKFISTRLNTIFDTEDYYNYNRSKELRQAVGFNDEPLPWITYPALEYLSQFDLSNFKVFEFGSGNSSIWFANRSLSVISAESNLQWLKYVQSKAKENLKVIACNENNFVETLLCQPEKFDIILIDSHRRKECAEIAPNHLSNDGIIIFDNSDRFPSACKILREKGFLEIDFKGFGPINKYTWITSIFFKNAKNLPLRHSIPTISYGGEIRSDVE